MSDAKLVFLITVGDDGHESEGSFDRSDTRRLQQGKSGEWRVDYDLPSRIHNVVCGNDFPSMSMFSNICGMTEMRIADQLGPSEMRLQPRAAWAVVADRQHRDLVVANARIARALQLGSVKPLPEIKPLRLYGLVLSSARLEHLIPIEDKDEFNRLLEGVSVRTAAGA